MTDTINNPDGLDAVTYTLRVVDKLEDEYHLRMPRHYTNDGEALRQAQRAIMQSFAYGLPVSEAAFVLCNCIQRQRQ